ncbi:RtcB family protein [Nitrococcus mobilis]|uniref:tRNA-splicing ligase RtcB n=1 Tax=Nitrococcus mobilis Nb-231 TaxID=314278 RepID=A4BUG2_9GAMM|nr:RtcB family protein [Nitrococcus mobilis]EAR20676.1 hypothetical protein NB231_02128 [Nitrococcus mobilis Nb-231]
MDLSRFTKRGEFAWEVAPREAMHVPAIVYADEALMHAMDEKVYTQVTNVAKLPGIVKACYAMPDAHWGYGFPIGGVAAFDPARDGVVSAGGVGFDISCGVRCLHTGLHKEDLEANQKRLVDTLFERIPCGVGRTGPMRLRRKELDAMLSGGAEWAVSCGYGTRVDLERIEERGCMRGARAEEVSAQAKDRQCEQMGTLGSGNHYLEVQHVAKVFDYETGSVFGLSPGDIVVSIHCGSRALGHQIGTDFLKKMLAASAEYGIKLPDRELACAPIESPLGQSYLGAMRAGINCALANRQIITYLTRQVFADVLPKANLTLLYDVSHNTCKEEVHVVDGKRMPLYVHRKGATRALGPGHPDLPAAFHPVGQPVLIGGTMGTASYVLVGTMESAALSFSSACHGAGRAMSRHQAVRHWRGREVLDELATRGILVRSPSMRALAEEAPLAYKDVSAVVDAADRAGLARKVAKLEPVVCIKG